MSAYRQTMPCLLEQGEVHESLKAGRDKMWAGRNPDITTRHRSVIGIHESGSILFYGVGIEATPKLLAEGMKYAGAFNATQLDINWGWMRFLLFGERKSDGQLGVTSTLIDQMVHGRTQYVKNPSDRDFFYLSWRQRSQP
jgi:hypothetical protein